MGTVPGNLVILHICGFANIFTFTLEPMSPTWKNYQEEAAAFFRALGLSAETDVTLEGVRTQHDVDVLVKSQHVGFEITWVVECKHWKTSVSKLHVLALRQIVTDLGADRGILLAESGYQSGAVEAANLTNIQLTTLAELGITSQNAIYSMRLQELFNRVQNCNDRYWEIPKDTRIEVGLRPESSGYGYLATQKINLVKDLLARSFRGHFPFSSDTLEALVERDIPQPFHSQQEVLSFTEPIITELERLLDAADLKGT